MKRFTLTATNGPDKGSDPLEGTVTIDNAALTTMTKYVSGPNLGTMTINDVQLREATTPDGYYYPDTRGRGPTRRQRIRYHVRRLTRHRCTRVHRPLTAAPNISQDGNMLTKGPPRTRHPI